MSGTGKEPVRTGRVLRPLEVERDLEDELVVRAYLQRQYQTILDPDMPMRYEPEIKEGKARKESAVTSGIRVRQDRSTRRYSRWGNR